MLFEKNMILITSVIIIKTTVS